LLATSNKIFIGFSETRENVVMPGKGERSFVGGYPVKEAWVKLEEWSKDMVTAALECGADAIVVPPGCQERIKALGRITTVSEDGDLKPGEEVCFEKLSSAADEARIERLLRRAAVVIDQEQCEVIPLENLVAAGGRLLVAVRSGAEIDVALGVLEKGVAGVLIHAASPEQLRELVSRVKIVSERQPLRPAVIEKITRVGSGDRVCVDTCTTMSDGEGMLVGNFSSFLFLVQAETRVNPYVAPRPFRVNAGAVHSYVKVPGGRTRYLSELQSGDPVLIVHAQGTTQTATVGRAKVERRPLLLIEAGCEGTTGSVLVQNAETIRLTGVDGEARSVANLEPGDTVLVALEPRGRHFGRQVDETIREL
jgi:3-dehydroquinate synthase II